MSYYKPSTVRTWGNPFTHEEHSRSLYPNTNKHKVCSWCGQKPSRLYQYNSRRGLFCNKNCYSAYYDLEV